MSAPTRSLPASSRMVGQVSSVVTPSSSRAIGSAGPLVDERLGVEGGDHRGRGAGQQVGDGRRGAHAGVDPALEGDDQDRPVQPDAGRVAPSGVEGRRGPRARSGSQCLHIGERPLAEPDHACRRTGRRRCGRRPPPRRRSGRRHPGGCRPASRCRRPGSRGRPTRRARWPPRSARSAGPGVANPGRAVGATPSTACSRSPASAQ